MKVTKLQWFLSRMERLIRMVRLGRSDVFADVCQDFEVNGPRVQKLLYAGRSRYIYIYIPNIAVWQKLWQLAGTPHTPQVTHFSRDRRRVNEVQSDLLGLRRHRKVKVLDHLAPWPILEATRWQPANPATINGHQWPSPQAKPCDASNRARVAKKLHETAHRFCVIWSCHSSKSSKISEEISGLPAELWRGLVTPPAFWAFWADFVLRKHSAQIPRQDFILEVPDSTDDNDAVVLLPAK